METYRCRHNSSDILYEENLELQIDVAPNRAQQDDVVELGSGGTTIISGTKNYNELFNKPSINGHILQGNITLEMPHYTAGDNIIISPTGVISATNNYTLPAATRTKLGGVIIGDNINLNDGIISVDKYELPIASSETLGGIKLGQNITNEDGVISLTKQNIIDALGYEPGSGGTSTLAGPFNNGLMSSSDYIKLSQFSTASNYATKKDIEGLMTYKGSATYAPSNPQNGQVYYNTYDNQTYIYTGAWKAIAPKAFTQISVNSQNLLASTNTTLTLIAGTNISIVPNVITGTITISSSGGSGATNLATQKVDGLMSSQDKIKLDTLPEFGSVGIGLVIEDSILKANIASSTEFGVVKSSAAINKINVGTDGSMTINNVSLDKLVAGVSVTKIPSSLLSTPEVDGGLKVEDDKIVHANAAIDPGEGLAFRKIAYDEYGHITDSMVVSSGDLGIYDIFTNTAADLGLVPTIEEEDASILVSDGKWYDTLILYGGTSVQGV